MVVKRRVCGTRRPLVDEVLKPRLRSPQAAVIVAAGRVA